MAAADNPMLRLFNATETPASEPQRNVGGSWAPSTRESAAPFSAVAWHFGASLQRELGVPVGIIHSASGGTIAICWTSEEMLATNPDSAYYADAYEKRLAGYPAEVLAAEKSLLQRSPTAIHKRAPSKLFNGMIAPLASTTVRGVIWYQGESDSWRAPAYERLFQDLITDWRAQWREPGLPFLFVVLAGLEADPRQVVNYPYLRETQLAALALPGVSAASAVDVGEAHDIHPRRKQPVGERLALAALADVYGRDILAKSPMMASTRVEDSRLLVEFAHAGEGLQVDGPVGGFELAGDDGVYHAAEATIEGTALVAVTSAAVPEPRTVRYCWTGFPANNLQNSAGLPAMPFRTDDTAWIQP
jgi:sialate O-acetylesterase